jgi:hypothetical protein
MTWICSVPAEPILLQSVTCPEKISESAAIEISAIGFDGWTITAIPSYATTCSTGVTPASSA